MTWNPNASPHARSPEEWDAMCSKNRSRWLAHNASHPWETIRFYCGLWDGTKGQESRRGRVDPARGFEHCPACGKAEHGDADVKNFTSSAKVMVTETWGGGKRVKCVVVTEEDGWSWIAEMEP